MPPPGVRPPERQCGVLWAAPALCGLHIHPGQPAGPGGGDSRGRQPRRLPQEDPGPGAGEAGHVPEDGQ